MTTYVRAGDTELDERRSEARARWESARDQGAAYPALLMLRAALWIAQDTLTDTEVRQAVDEAMSARYPRPVFDNEPNMPAWALGQLEDDTRFQPVDAIRVQIPGSLVADVLDGVLNGVMVDAAQAIDGDTARWRAASMKIQAGRELAEMLDGRAGAVPLALTPDQATQLAAAITYAADGTEDDARAAESSTEILRLARTAVRLRALHAKLEGAGR